MENKQNIILNYFYFYGKMKMQCEPIKEDHDFRVQTN